MKLLLQDVIKAVEGECLHSPEGGSESITGIHTDSRQALTGCLFVPLKGERFDGHTFLTQVGEKGAVATLTQVREVPDRKLYTIYVKDTGKALLQLACHYRKMFSIPLVGVTGSVGKTSTKEIIAAVLSGKWQVHKTEGNFNNEIGLPLTLFGLQKEHEVAVIEMGMNHFGEISRLSQTALPDVAVITNIGTSHIENLGSREGILKAKLEILDGLSPNGLLVINGDNDLLREVKDLPCKVIRYGLDKEHPYYAESIVCETEYTSAKVHTPQASYNVRIAALGEHMIYNTLAAIAIAEHYGLTVEEIQKGIASYRSPKMRMHITKTKDEIICMNDAYNASPDSMEAALKVLENYPCQNKRIAVLGDMLEMGEFAPSLHKQVGEFVATRQIDVLCAVGPLAQFIYEGASSRDSMLKNYYFKSKEDFIEEMRKIIHSGDTVLFKASRGMKFEELIDGLGRVNDDE